MRLGDPEFVKRLEMLALLARKLLSGSLRSDRKTLKRGSGTTFADYSEYKLGDELRHLDWNIYGRLETMVVKLFEIEEDATVSVLLDLSPSMAAKLDFSRKLAAALGYIALHRHDRLAVYGFADGLRQIFAPGRGRSRIFPMLEALERTELFGSATDPALCVRQFQARSRRPGLCVLISDFLAPGLKEALAHLRWARDEVHCLQVIDPAELSCQFRGDVELRCVESGASKTVTVGEAEARRFAELFREWNQTVADECARQGIGFSSALSDEAFEDVIQNILRRGGLLS